MPLSLGYRRPAHVGSQASRSRTQSVTTSLGSACTAATPYGIPDALAFERIISGGACPPCTTRDFMNYLTYVEHSAENLQFYLWFRDYVKRFDALPESEKALSPPCAVEKAETPRKGPRPAKTPSGLAAVLKGTDFDRPQTPMTEKALNPFDEDDQSSKWDGETSTLQSSVRSDAKKSAAAAFEAADIKLQPFTVQPFREEIARIISIYIVDGGARQLNLAARERTELLRGLAATTHPSAFHEVCKTTEWTLRHQAHPNFIRWSICNGNRPRVAFARFLGVAGIVGGLLCIVLITLSSANRGWRAIAAIPLLIGISTLFAAWKGMCVVLHGMHHRHLRPWELFVDEDQATTLYEMRLDSQNTVASANSYEDEPWVARYQKRNPIRKVFDREVWIQEPALRQIQDTIFVQALLVAVLGTGVIVGVFAGLPYFDRL